MSDVSYTEHEDPLIDASEHSSPIFAQKKFLEAEYVPDVDRIVGRDDEIRQVAQRIENHSHGTSPTSFIIYGKTGTGKTLVARHVATRVEQTALVTTPTSPPRTLIAHRTAHQLKPLGRLLVRSTCRLRRSSTSQSREWG